MAMPAIHRQAFMQVRLFTAARAAAFALAALLSACGGNGGGAPSSATVAFPPAAALTAPVLALTPTAIKAFHFSWAGVAGASEYRLLEDADGTSGYTLIATLPAGSTQIDHAVFLPERINARYLLQACQASACVDSAAVTASGPLVEAIGYVKASDPASDAQFGQGMALSANGQTLAVGAPGGNSLNSASGAVYLFARDGTTWRQQARLEAPTPQSNDGFGYSLALSSAGDTLAVGAPHDSQTANYGGAVYVYTGQGAAWALQTRLTGLNTSSGDAFGGSVALSAQGDVLAVGADQEAGSGTGANPPDDNNSPQSGAAYVFARQGNAWSQQAYLKASTNHIGDQFGRRIALSADGHTLAVGMPSPAGGGGGTSGSVHVYAHDGLVWGLQAFLSAPNPLLLSGFGEALALSADGQVLAVGSPYDSSAATGIDGDPGNTGATFSGAAYVFTRNNASWGQRAYIKASNTGANDRFGTTLALSSDGQTLAVGAISESSDARGIGGDQGNDNAPDTGAAYLFTHSATGWRQQAYIKPSNTAEYSVYQFGAALALSGDGQALAVACPYANNATAGVGGDQTDASGVNVGAVYLY